MLFNIYYQMNGSQTIISNKTKEQTLFWVEAILNVGGEITSIINVEND